MKFKKILILLLTILITVSLLSGCKKEDTTQKIATPSQVETQSVEPSTEAQYGLLSSDAKVEIIDYNDKIKDEYVAPDNIGACVFSILTSNIIEEPIYKNIGNGSELSTVIAKYSDIISAKNFNMTYNEETQ